MRPAPRQHPCLASFPMGLAALTQGLVQGALTHPQPAPPSLGLQLSLCPHPHPPSLCRRDHLPFMGRGEAFVSYPPPPSSPSQDPELLAQCPRLSCSHFPALNYPALPHHSSATNYFKREGPMLALALLSRGCWH